MKKIITLLATALLAVLPLAARTASDPELMAKEETKELQFNNFTGLDISWIYQVELTQAPRHGVRVEAPDFLMPYLRIELLGNRLILGVGELPRDVRRRIETGSRNQVRAYVSMLDLTELTMSGASKLTVKGEFSSRKDFRVQLSGATEVRDLNVRGSVADIDLSGASKFEMGGKFDKMIFRGSGSIHGTLALDAKTVDLNLSGASKLSMKGKYGTLTLRGSGAANTEIVGVIDDLDANCSSAAKLNAGQAPARRAVISFSGAANGTIDVKDELSVNLSGASRLNYHGGPSLRIKSQTVSRASTLSSF
jgi:hypothetical protein